MASEEVEQELPPGTEGIQEAARSGNVEGASEWLRNNGTKARVLLNGLVPGSLARSALTWAAYTGHHQVASLLLAGDADVERVDDYGLTALQYAVEKRNYETVQLLGEAGSANLDVGADMAPSIQAGVTTELRPGHECKLSSSTRLWVDASYGSTNSDLDITAIVMESDVKTGELNGKYRAISCYDIQAERDAAGVLSHDLRSVRGMEVEYAEPYFEFQQSYLPAPTPAPDRVTPWLHLSLPDLAAEGVETVFIVLSPLINDGGGPQESSRVASRGRAGAAALRRDGAPQAGQEEGVWRGTLQKPVLRFAQGLQKATTLAVTSLEPLCRRGSHREALGAVLYRKLPKCCLVARRRGEKCCTTQETAYNQYLPWWLRVVSLPVPGEAEGLRSWAAIYDHLRRTFPFESMTQRPPGLSATPSVDLWQRRVSRLGRPPLAVAAQRGDKTMVALLLEGKATVDVADDEGRTAFMLAVRAGHLGVVEEFLTGVSQDNKIVRARPFKGFLDESGYSAVHFAVQYQFVDVLKLLLKDKADADQRSKDRSTPIFALTKPGKGTRGSKESIIDVLLDFNADLNAQDSSRSTAVIHHATHGRWDVVHSLVDHDASVVEMNSLGHSALLLAAEANQQDLVVKLIKHGAGLEVFGAVASMSSLTETHVRSALEEAGLGPESRLDHAQFKDIWKKLQLPDALASGFYHALDRNKDGTIEFYELLGLGVVLSHDPQEASSFFFKVFDVDNSGFIDYSEFEHIIQASLKFISATVKMTLVKWLVEDTADRLAAADEFEDNEKKLIHNIFCSMDKNDDKKITREEFMAASKKPELRRVLFPLAGTSGEVEQVKRQLTNGIIPPEELPKEKRDGGVDCRMS